MGNLVGILAGIAANPSFEASVGNLLAALATRMIANATKPDEIVKDANALLSDNGKVAQALRANTGLADPDERPQHS